MTAMNDIFIGDTIEVATPPQLLGMMLTGDGGLAANILITFDEALLAGAGTVTIRGEGGIVFQEAIGGSSRITIVNNTLTIDPVFDMKYGHVYSLELSDGIVTDLAGTPFVAASSQFYTAILSPVAVVSNGSSGSDILYGSDLNDTLSGGDGDDHLQGHGGDDVLDGGAGVDSLHSGGGNNTLSGGAGKDYLQSDSNGNNRLDGGDDDDYLYGGAGNDTYLGGAGDDTIYLTRSAAGGSWSIDGGAGNDLIRLLSADSATAIMASGGAGSDTFYLQSINNLTISDFAAGANGDVLSLEPILNDLPAYSPNPFGAEAVLRLQQQGADTVVQIDRDGAAGSAFGFVNLAVLKNVNMASLTDDNFSGVYRLNGDATGIVSVGSDTIDYLYGTDLNDHLTGLGGADVLFGGYGNDTLEGSAGADFLFGQQGDDRLFGQGDIDDMNGAQGDDYLDGGAAGDQMIDRFGNNTMVGGDGDDYMEDGSTGSGLLMGQEGHDHLVGMLGNDTLIGGVGHDTLEVRESNLSPDQLAAARIEHLMILDAGDGNDTIKTSFMPDSMTNIRATGGGGADIYAFQGAPGLGSYVITDFDTAAGGDLIDLLAYFAPTYSGLNPFDPAANAMKLVQRGADLVIQYNMDATGATSQYRDMVTMQGVSAASLTKDHFVAGINPDGSNPAVNLSGSNSADSLSGTMFNDTLSGGAGNDILSGLSGNDSLDGGSGNDILDGGRGTNVLTGGAGIDTALYSPFVFYDVSRDGANWKVWTYGVSGITQSLDTLIGVERIKFGTSALAIDIDGTGGQVYRLYQAAFDRTPDRVGVGFWMEMVDRGTLTIADVASEFVKSSEFTALYGANPTNTELVDHFYQNLLHREPDAVGRAFWINVLDNHLATVATVLSAFSESAENQDNVAQVIAHGFGYEPWMG